MEKYLGVKLINAEPCYGLNNKCVDPMSEHCGQEKEGYKVVYEDGYTSWSPKDVFEKSYRNIKHFDYSLEEKCSEEYQIRVCEETKELQNKINKLDFFITNPAATFATLSKEEQIRLRQQLLAMQYYLTILVERINNF